MTQGRKGSFRACGADLARVFGAGTGVCAFLFGLFGLLHFWFMRCAAVATDWGAVLGLKG